LQLESYFPADEGNVLHTTLMCIVFAVAASK
jgi:hypothetical protein